MLAHRIPTALWVWTLRRQDGCARQYAIADAVLAKRYLNVTLNNLNPDKTWAAVQVGDGPVVMKTFSKPFDELGGVFIDFKANRLRSVTLRNTVGIQIVSAADGSRKTVATPAGARVTNATITPTGLALDRHWMIVDGDGMFVTQREQPRLALLRPTLPLRPTLLLPSKAAAALRI